MRKFLVFPALVAVAGAAIWVMVGSAALGATAGSVSVAAVTMQPIATSTHNSFATPACGTQVVSTAGTENHGVLFGSAGGALAPISLPQGATVTAFVYTFRDNDTDVDTFAYLVRKKLGKYPVELNGYAQMAVANSSSANDRVRQDSTTSIANPLVDNTQFAYFLETVTCGTTLEPIGIQVEYTTP